MPLFKSHLGGKDSFGRILETLSTIDSEVSKVKVSSKVCEFSDIFAEDLLGLPLTRAIGFSIDLVPDTLPISIPSYHMAPVNLKELKVQLDELLHKEFISSSASLWGALVFFVKKKDGSIRELWFLSLFSH